MFAVPGAIPVTTPELLPTVATDVLPLVHEMPPGVVQVTLPVVPIHILDIPPIAAGAAFTVTSLVAAQPVARI